MSILSELKKLTGKQNAKVVSEALPDSTGGGGNIILMPNDVDPSLIPEYVTQAFANAGYEIESAGLLNVSADVLVNGVINGQTFVMMHTNMGPDESGCENVYVPYAIYTYSRITDGRMVIMGLSNSPDDQDDYYIFRNEAWLINCHEQLTVVGG